MEGTSAGMILLHVASNAHATDNSAEQLVKTDGIQGFQFGNQKKRETSAWQQQSIMHSKLEIYSGRGGGVTCICRGYGDVPLFWVLFWGLLPDFWVSFFGKI